jgi:CubicO group peptidase (beta-lactamase class C family)
MKNKASIGILFLIVSVYCQNILAQTDNKTKAEIRKVESGLIPPVRFEGDSAWTIEGRMKHYGVPGLSIAVIKDSKIIWIKSYGVTDRETKLPVTSRTLFQAASISKPVSAYAALKEVERGKINLDEDVNSYLKSWKLPENEFTAKKKVSLKYILSHSAGLTASGFAGYAIPNKVPTLLQVLNGVTPANSEAIRVYKEPGGTFSYSGGGYCIAQQMLIDIEGKPFPEIMQELVLGPLGMKNSTYSQPLPAEKLKWAATGYLPDGKQTPGKRHTYPEMAPAGLWTTAEDLAKFAIDLQLTIKGQSKKVLSQQMADKMTSPLIEPFEGLGIFLEKKQQDIYFNHGGWNEGFSSKIIAHKDKGYGLAILTNGNQPMLIEELIRSVASTYEWPNYVLPVYKKIQITAADIENNGGRFRSEKYELIRIYANGEKLFLQKNAEEPEELFKVAADTYALRNWETQTKIVRNPSDHIRYMASVLSTDSVPYTNPELKAEEKVPFEFILDGQFEKALSAYKQAKTESPEHFALSQPYINRLGYRFLKIKEIKKAIDIFKVNTILYPNSGDVYDSLGEAYLAAGDKNQARINYLLSLKLDPKNTNAAKIIKSLD